MRLLKENIELFFKKDSNFKRPLKTDVIYAKLTKGFVPHYEWNGHRRRIPWKLLKKDQTVNKFPSAFFTTKTGLHQSLQQLHWYSPFPVSSFFPRCYQVMTSVFVKLGLCFTVWKFQDFSVIQILREINFGESGSAKSANLIKLGALNLANLVNFSLKSSKFIKI